MADVKIFSFYIEYRIVIYPDFTFRGRQIFDSDYSNVLRIDYCGFGQFSSTLANLVILISLLKVLH